MTNRANQPGTFTEKFKSGRRHPLYRSTVLIDDDSETTDSASDNSASSFTSPGSLYERRWYILRYKCVLFLGLPKNMSCQSQGPIIAVTVIQNNDDRPPPS